MKLPDAVGSPKDIGRIVGESAGILKIQPNACGGEHPGGQPV